MKDIYSPLEIDEEWDNYAPMADGSSTALMERPAGVSTEGSTDGNGLDTEAAMATKIAVTSPDSTDVMPKSNVMPGSESSNTGTKEPTVPDAAYNAAEALIDTPAADADLVTTPVTTPGFAATDGDTFDINDTRGLVKITPEPTSGETTPGETTPETTIAGTPHEMIPVNVNVMGGEAADSGDKLPEVVDQSNGESAVISDATESIDTEAGEGTKITPFIAPVEPGEEPKDETKGDSDIVIDTGTITPDTSEKSTDTIEASDDDESNDDMVENSESDTADDTDDTESDTAASSSETKADKPKVENKDTAPASGGTTIEEFKSNLLKTLDTLGEERGETLASIEAGEKEKQKYTDDYNEKMAAINDRIKTANEKLTDDDKFIAQLESFK